MVRFSAIRLSFIAPLAASFLILATAAGQSTTQPVPVVGSSTSTIVTGLSQPHAVGRNSAGDLFVANSGTATLVEIPHTGGPQVTLATIASYPEGVAVDPSGNIFTTDFSGYLWKAPAGGGANSGAQFTNGSTCPDFAAIGYYIGFDDVSSDGAGNIYAASNNVAYLYEFDPTGSSCTELLTPATLGGASVRIGNIAADGAGDVYYSVGNSLYVLAAKSTSPTAIPGTFAGIAGLRVDANGDLFITDKNSIDEIPFVNGALAPSELSYLTSFGPVAAIAIDPIGNLYSANGAAQTILKTSIGSLALTSSAVGTQGTAGSINYMFNAAVTPTAYTYVSGPAASTEFATAAPAAGATTPCTVGTAYAASTSAAPSFCTLDVALTPAGVGQRTGALILNTASGVLATTYLSGTGLGAAVAVDPGVQTTLGSFTAPVAVAVDDTGDVFVADSVQSTVTEITVAGTSTTVGGGLSSPLGLVVDPAGNLFISDSGNNRVVEVPIAGTVLNTAAQRVVYSGLSAPEGLALDINGNLLIANSGAGTVVEIPNQGGVLESAANFTLGTGFSKPAAIAVDASNNIFVADAGNADVVEISSTSQTTVVTGFPSPQGLAVDAAGDLFLSQAGIASVTRVPFIGGSYSTNATSALGVDLQTPEGIALDTQDNLYVADSSAPAAYKIARTLGVLSFGNVNLGTTTAAQNLSLSNFGNQSLAISSPFFTGTGNTGDFTLTAPASDGCGTALAAGADCAISATFTPAVLGTRSEQVIFQTNAANQPGASLTGTGADLSASTLALTLVSPTGSISFGTPIVVMATVAPTSASSPTQPTGTVQFSVDGVASGASVSLLNGVATASLNKIPPGTHVINATYSGDINFASASATSALTETIGAATTTTTLTGTISGSLAVATGTSATFTATVTPSTTLANPSGTVSFIANGTTLGTAPLSANGQAVFTTTALPNGQYNVTAMYSGDTVFSTSTSAPYAVYVTVPTFVVTGFPTTLSVPSVGTTTATFTVSSLAGFSGAVAMVCNNLPANTVCTLSPTSIDLVASPAPETVQLTIQTGVAPPTTNVAGILSISGLLSLTALIGLRRRRLGMRLLSSALLGLLGILSASALSGCGVGLVKGTPAGNSTVAIQFTGTPGIISGGEFVPSGANMTQSASFALTVQ